MKKMDIHQFSLLFRCPSFKYMDGKLHRADIVVSSTCIAAGEESVWGDANPAGVADTDGTVIVSASANPEPGCGCEDLVLTGEVQEEDGKVFQCEIDPTINADGDTVITDDNQCFLACDGLQVFDLYCSTGQWSVPFLVSAQDIYCHGGGTTDASGSITLSTFWPPGKREVQKIKDFLHPK